MDGVFGRTIYGEARGASLADMAAVANAVMNRVVRGGWWGDTIEAVCLKPYQFSCWNDGDPNRSKIEAVSDQNSVFLQCTTIAQLAADGLLRDMTNGATHYHTTSFRPGWAMGHEPCYRTNVHVFYNDID